MSNEPVPKFKVGDKVRIIVGGNAPMMAVEQVIADDPAFKSSSSQKQSWMITEKSPFRYRCVFLEGRKIRCESFDEAVLESIKDDEK